MMRRLSRGAALLLALALLPVGAAARPAASAEAVASELQPAGWVTDAAHVLTPQQIRSLSIYLANFQARSRHQMAVVTVPSLDGRDVADFTLDLFNRWGVGRRGANDGIFVLVAPTERKVRITVGYGMEKLLPNAYCARVIEAMMPALKAGRYYDGLILGVTGLARVARRS